MISRRRWYPLIFLVMGMVALTAEQGRPQAPATDLPPAQPPKWLDGFHIRYQLRVAGDPADFKTQTVLAQLPTGGWLKPDGSDVAVQAASGELLPSTVLSHDPAGTTIVQFKSKGKDRWYWAYAAGGSPGPKLDPAKEGMTLELRDWAGDDLESWAKVLGGLKKSETVIGNAVVANVVHNCNPVRPDEPRKFAASYRGHLNILKDGVYRFFVNADDAAFLFIDGFKVCERTGANTRLTGQVPLKSIGTDVELKAGAHSFEVHHIVGNNPSAVGYCALLWMPPEQKHWSFVPSTAFVPALVAEVAALEEARGASAATFAFGVDDSLTTAGVTIYLVRFEAQGNLKDGDRLVWDFGDGTTGTGRSMTHIYFKGGSYPVTLRSADGLPPFRRTVHVWPAPVPTSPFSLALAVKSLAEMDWKKLDSQRINQMFEFLLACEQSERWPLVEAVARHLLTEKDQDPKLRMLLHTSLMEAVATQGRAREALKQVEPALQEFGKVPSLRIGVQLTAADIHRRYLGEAAEASKLYQSIIEGNRRLEHPNVRLAAVRWGDLFAEAGELARAGEAYRAARELGGEKFKNTAQTEAVTRGALLRIAEQKLRSGDIRHTRQLLERIELDYPEQKLEGLYRFLRAEADRFGGRYEEAIRNYEFLLKLTQWAGYRDRALHGIADSYLRLGDAGKALEWLAALKKSFPGYYEKHKLGTVQSLAETRLTRAKAGPEGRPFAGFRTGFEPGDQAPPGQVQNFRTVAGQGMAGPHVCVFEQLPVIRIHGGHLQYDLKNITPNSTYWVEFWYRDVWTGSTLPHLISPIWQVYFYGGSTGTDHNPEGGFSQYQMERGYGRWRKCAFSLRAPPAQDGRVMIYLQYVVGRVEIDGLSIQPVSDRQSDLLHNFVEGADQ